MRKTNFWDFACSAAILGFGYKIFKTVANSITGAANNEVEKKKNDILDRITKSVNDFLNKIDKDLNKTDVKDEEPAADCPDEVEKDIPDDVDSKDLALEEEKADDNA